MHRTFRYSSIYTYIIAYFLANVNPCREKTLYLQCRFYAFTVQITLISQDYSKLLIYN